MGLSSFATAGTLGFLQPDSSDEEKISHEKIEKALRSTFRPEFLNRIDEIIMFSALTDDQMLMIVDLQMKEIEKRLDEQGLKVEVTDKARTWIAKEGFDPNFGARPLKRILQKHVESPLSMNLLAGLYKHGDTVKVDLDTDGKQLVFTKK